MELHALKKRTQRAGGWLLAVAIVVVGWLAFGHWSKPSATDDASASTPADVTSSTTSIEVPRQVAALNHMAIAVARLPTRERELELRGELAIDFNRLVQVHPLFPGRIVELATVEDAHTAGAQTAR